MCGGVNTVIFTVQDFSSLLSTNTESDSFSRIFPTCLCFLSINTVIFICQGFPHLPLLLECQYRVRFTLQDLFSLPLLPEYQYRVRFILQDFSTIALLLEYHYRVIFISRILPASLCYLTISAESDLFCRNFCPSLFLD